MRCAQDMEELIRTTTSGRIAGFIGEPIQGVGGFITPPKEYFQIVEKIVRNHGGIFISDEVQTGWGRTGGKWFGIEQWGVTPDIITSAKGLGNGSPIGLTVARPEVADAVKGLTISTFGGNPVTTTAAKAVIDFIEEQNLLANCAETGAYLRGRLEELKDKHALIGDVRGMGLLQAIELVEDRKTKAPAAAADRAWLMEAARENRTADRQGRHVRQRAAHFAAHEHRPRRRGPVHRTAGQEPGGVRSGGGGRRSMSAAALPLERNLEQFPELHPALDSQSALAEANRCLFCFDAPCTAACPTHIDVPRFIKKIATGNLRGSALTILDANILGLSCSRVCPVDVLCEGACVMQRYNQKPIEIGRLQRFAMDRFYDKARDAAWTTPAPNAHGAKWPASAAVRRRWPARRNCAGGVTPSPSSTTGRCPAD